MDEIRSQNDHVIKKKVGYRIKETIDQRIKEDIIRII
jgi:hypothetical protein